MTKPCIFYVYGSVNCESMSIIVQRDATVYSLLYFCKLLYMFRVATPPIIRSTYNCNYSICHWSSRLCYLPLSRRSWNVTIYSLLYFCKLLYTFRVVTPSIIRSTYNCNYSIWHGSSRLCYLPLSRRSWNATIYSLLYFCKLLYTFRVERVWPVPDAVITVICAPDDGWSYHPKHVEQFTEI